MGKILIMFFLLLPLMAYSNDYFDSEINYWRKNKREEPKDNSAALTKKASSPKDETFDWQKHLNPKNPDFFKEGDYTPPEPFMELVRNPTDANIRMWFAYIEKKNTLSERLAQRMQEYMEGHRAAFPSVAKEKVLQALSALPTPNDDFERYRFRAYFDSTCPHCQKMTATLNDLQDRGYFVEARQVDDGPVRGLHVPIVKASKEELKKFKVNSVPLLLIGDLKRKTVYRQAGFTTPEDVITQLRKK